MAKDDNDNLLKDLLDTTKDTNKLIQNLVRLSQESKVNFNDTAGVAAGAAIGVASGVRAASYTAKDLAVKRKEALSRLSQINTGTYQGKKLDPEQQQMLSQMQQTKLNNIGQAQQSKNNNQGSNSTTNNMFSGLGLGTIGLAAGAAKATTWVLGVGEARVGMSNMQAYQKIQKDSLETIDSPLRRFQQGHEGAFYGAAGGAAAGAIAGSVIPVIGTAAGALIGGLAGGAGGEVGEWLGHKYQDWSGVAKGGR